MNQRKRMMADLDQDIRDYLEIETKENIERGMSPEEARYAALRKFGNVTRVREATHGVWSVIWLERLLQDVRFGVRSLMKSRRFTVAAILALALGIGANTAVFSVVNTVLLKPLTYPDPSRIVQFKNTYSDGSSPLASNSDFNFWRAQTSVFQDVAAYEYRRHEFNLTGATPEQVHGLRVSRDFFRLFGAQVLLGRTFTSQEDSPNGPHVAVMSYGFWQRQFGGNPKIVGSSVSLSDESYTIVGVIGRSFSTDPAADLWVPLQIAPNSTGISGSFYVSARLKSGVTLAQANAELKLATGEYRRLYPNDMGPEGGFRVEPLRDSIVAGARKSLLILLAAVSFVLLIACANVANLLLARAAGRRREFAIRAAMGASRLRIVRQLLTESMVLALSGGILGLVFGLFGVRALLAAAPAVLPRVGERGVGVGVDWRVLAFTVGACLITGILFGLFPAIGASRLDSNTALKEGGNQRDTGFREGKVRSFLVISEVSLALVLSVGAALLIRTCIALRNVHPGFDAHNVVTLQMTLSGNRFMTTSDVAQVSRGGRKRLDAIPGLEASAYGSCGLPILVGCHFPFNIIGRPTGKSRWTGIAFWQSTSPDYFSVFRIPFLRGRDFTNEDNGAAPGVVIINEAFASQYWPKENPLGKQILIGKGIGAPYVEGPRRIIGIVSNVHDGGLNHHPYPLMIIPVAQVPDAETALVSHNNGNGGFWVVRTHSDPHPYIPVIAKELRLASGGFPVGSVRPMTEIVAQSTASQDFNMLLFTIFGLSALILAAIGIYGLMAYSVQQRSHEIGIRVALGADRGRVRNFVLWHGMRLAIVGVAIGLAAAFGLTRFLASLLFGVKAWDPIAFTAAPVILSIVALIAVWLPASRASRLDPQQALRAE